MDKYKATAEKRLSNTKSYGNHKIHPEELARRAHVQGKFAARERDEFFDEAYSYFDDYFDEIVEEIKGGQSVNDLN